VDTLNIAASLASIAAAVVSTIASVKAVQAWKRASSATIREVAQGDSSTLQNATGDGNTQIGGSVRGRK
jgi:hypothetical protein